MAERYFLEPYRFIAPIRTTFWVRMMRGMIRRHLRQKQGVHHYHFSGMEHLRASLDQKSGILLAPNHCRIADPMVVGIMAQTQMRKYLYYIASYHLFRQSKFTGWILNRLGGYSIYREGADRESIRTTSRLLAEGERPIVLFPEGTWFRQNDRIAPLQDGLSLITRQAARQSMRPIVIHPIAIKYWLLEDITARMLDRLAGLEKRIGWHPQTQLGIIDRIAKLGGALLALKEIELMGQPRPGDLDSRIRDLTFSEVERLERHYLGKVFEGWALERIRRLRQHLMRLLMEKVTDEAACQQFRKDLGDLLFCENLNAQSLDYVRQRPSQERLAETVQRIEETLTDEDEVPLGKLGVAIRVGPAIDVRTFPHHTGEDRKGGDPLVTHLRRTMQELIDQQLAEGPPPEWGCPLLGSPPQAALQVPTSSPTHAEGQLIG